MHQIMERRLHRCALAVCLTLCRCIFAQQNAINPPAVPEQRSLADTSQRGAMEIALIAALGALVGVLLKDLIFKIWEERRTRNAARKAVYSRYGDPLSSSAVSLMWRLHEALEQPGRGRFLKSVGLPAATNKYSTFGAYKKLSTLYRLAILLGWIQACRREFSYLKVVDRSAAEPIEEAMSALESALADGPAVEVERLEKLCSLWGLLSPLDLSRRSSMAVDLEASIDQFMQESKMDEIENLANPQKESLARCAAEAMSAALNVQNVPGNVIAETWARAIQIIDIKEAWIYRDWQSAIGDLMLTRVESGERGFDVIAFGEFESLSNTGTNEQKKWISRLSAVFDGIDLSQRDPYDHRPDQLLSVMRATARLTRALSLCVENTAISQKSLELANRLSER